jgi:hypothetical protein
MQRLYREIERDLAELHQTGSIAAARTLAAATGQHFNSTQLPCYFFGELQADLVMIHLNPKQPNLPHDVRQRPTLWGLPWPQTLPEYLDAFGQFGDRMYGASAPRTHRSPFDHKQVRFLRSFGDVELVADFHPDARYENLRRAIDHKLQLELVPYGSSTFAVTGFSAQVLHPHWARIMEVVVAHPRRHVLFCGQVFEKLLRPYLVEVQRFHLAKGDGQPTAQLARFALLRIPWEGHVITAGLAYSFARQGIPMGAYAAECRRRYDEMAGER